MSSTNPLPAARLNPVHIVLLAGSLPLFLGTLLSDWAYSATYEIQWTNFASWLLAGALLFSGLALLWSLIALIRADRRGHRIILAFMLLLATWIVGFVNALVHARDGWAVMPEAPILSLIVTFLVLAAIWFAFSASRSGEG